jgi:hypothetical protein
MIAAPLEKVQKRAISFNLIPPSADLFTVNVRVGRNAIEPRKQSESSWA